MLDRAIRASNDSRQILAYSMLPTSYDLLLSSQSQLRVSYLFNAAWALHFRRYMHEFMFGLVRTSREFVVIRQIEDLPEATNQCKEQSSILRRSSKVGLQTTKSCKHA